METEIIGFLGLAVIVVFLTVLIATPSKKYREAEKRLKENRKKLGRLGEIQKSVEMIDVCCIANSGKNSLEIERLWHEFNKLIAKDK